MQIDRRFSIVLIIISNLLMLVQSAAQPTCFCHENECCSRWGYCGKTDDYCGTGCQSGPCYGKAATAKPSFSLSFDLFTCAFPDIDVHLRARRYHGLLAAIGQMAWYPKNEIELVTFLAHVSHETDGLRTLVEYCSKHGTCDNYQISWCDIEAHENVQYYGRGWFQLSYPCNYYSAGKAVGLDLLTHPDLVSESEKIAASTAIWYFKESGMNVLAQQGLFANTTRKLNEYECQGKAGYHLQAARIKTFQRILPCFDLPHVEENLIC